MKTYLRLAAIGFAICALIAYVFIAPLSVVPWQQQKFEVAGSYFSAGGAYLFALTAVIRDVLTRKRVWSDPRVRGFGVLLIGASFGLFILGWIAIDGTKVLEDMKIEVYNRFICENYEKAHLLVSQLELLNMCQIVVERAARYAAIYAILSALGVWLYDTFKTKWVAASFIFGLFLQIPLYLAGELEHLDRSGLTLQIIEKAAVLLLFRGIVAGLMLVVIVWTVRNGWWKSTSPSKCGG